MAQIIHFKDLPCIKGNKKKPAKYTETFRKNSITCEACLKELNNTTTTTEPLTDGKEKTA